MINTSGIILNQMPPFIDVRIEIILHFPVAARRNHGHCTTCVKLFTQPVRIKRLSASRQQRLEIQAINERRNTHDIMALARQQDKAHEIAQSVDKRHDFRRQSAL